MGQCEAVLVEVDALGAGGDTAHEGEVSALAAHRLGHEAAVGGGRRLLDRVQRTHGVVQGGVRSDAQLAARQVVVDRGGHADDRDLEGGVAVPLRDQLVCGQVGVEPADDEQGVDSVGFDGASQRVELLDGGDFAPRAQLGAAVAHPALDVVPAQLSHVAVQEAGEAPVDPEHGEVVIQAEAHCRSRRRVHAGGETARVDDGDPLGLRARRLVRGGVGVELGGSGHGLEDPQHLPEARAAGGHRPLVVPAGDEVFDGAGGADLLHHGQTADAVVSLGDDDRLGLRGGGDRLVGGRAAEQRRHPPVVGARLTTALNMAENRDAGVLAQPLGQDAFDVIGGDGVAGSVGGALGDNHHGLAAPGLTALGEFAAHVLLPAAGGRELGHQHVVAPSGDGGHEREVAAVPSHDLDDEGALVGGGGRGDVVDRLEDAMQGGVRADGHVGADEVVVDAPDQAGHHERGVGGGRLGGDLAALGQLGDEPGPVRAEYVGAGERAVSADDDETVDVVLQEVAGGGQLPVALAELRGAGGADDRAAAVEDRADRVPVERADAVASGDGAGPPLHDGVGLGAHAQGCPDDGAHGGIHPLRVTAGRQDTDPHRCVSRGVGGRGGH